MIHCASDIKTSVFTATNGSRVLPIAPNEVYCNPRYSNCRNPRYSNCCNSVAMKVVTPLQLFISILEANYRHTLVNLKRLLNNE